MIPKLLTLHGAACAGDFDQYPFYGAASFTDQQLSIIGRRLGADFRSMVETLDTYPELLGAARQVLSAPELLGAAKKGDPGKKISAGTGTGAAIGSAVGSVIPGLGTAVGGAVGTVIGTIGGLFAAFGKKKKKKKKIAVVSPATGRTEIKEIEVLEDQKPVAAVPGLPAVPARGASAPAVATAQKLAAVDAAGKGKTVILAGAAISLLALIMMSKKKGG